MVKIAGRDHFPIRANQKLPSGVAKYHGACSCSSSRTVPRLFRQVGCILNIESLDQRAMKSWRWPDPFAYLCVLYSVGGQHDAPSLVVLEIMRMYAFAQALRRGMTYGQCQPVTVQGQFLQILRSS